MKNSSARLAPVSGIIVPMVTPLTAPNELDAAGVERLVDRLLSGGVNGLFLLGTCGEGPSLSTGVRQALIDRVCRQVARRIPLLVGVPGTSPEDCAALARHAADAGADAIVVAPPCYFPLSQRELLAYVDQLVAASPLPVMLYNMPGLTKIEFEPDTVRRLMDDTRVIGIKDSSGDMRYFRRLGELTRQRSNWSLLVGPEHLLAEAIEAGGHGGVTGGANVWPQLFVQIYEAARAGFVDELAILESNAMRLGRIYTVEEFSAASVVKGLKAALACLKVCSGLPSPPLAPLPQSEVSEVEKIVHSLGLTHSAAQSLAAQQQ